MLKIITLGFAFCLFLYIPLLTAQSFYHTGSTTPVETDHQPGILLAGGASDNDDAMTWMLERADGGDIVVLRASGSDGYNNYLYSGLGVAVNSVTSIVIQSSEEASDEQVLEIVGNAEVIFIAGGNQWDYVSQWRDTPLLLLLNDLINNKKITIGGTSAGMAVLGQVVFSAENNTVWSSEALGNPFHWRLKLEKDFLEVPFMENTVTDSHYNRIEGDDMDRKGRHAAFLSRMINDWQMPARGIAANEYTAVGVDGEGKARVFGDPSYNDYAYFLQAYGGDPEVCQEDIPLHWNQQNTALMVYKVKGDTQGSAWFDLHSWVNGSGGNWQHWFVDNGVLVEGDNIEETGWIQIHVREEEQLLPLENAMVSLGSFEPLNTPSFGTVNFRGVESEGQLQYQVAREGFFTQQGDVSYAGQNVSVAVDMVKDDASFIPQRGYFEGISFYPNPGKDILHLDVTGFNQAFVMRIMNAQGSIVKEQTFDAAPYGLYRIKTGHLNPGVYFLELSSGGHRSTQTWIKQ